MGRSTFGSLAVIAAIAFAACGYKPAGSVSPTAKGGSSAGGTSGAGGVGGGGGAGGSGGSTNGRGGMTPIIILDAGPGADRNCGEKSKMAMKVPPEVLIVLDRSGSMNEDISGGTCADGGVGAQQGCGATSKWALITPAIKQVVAETDSDVHWGLKYFPDNQTNTCTVNTTAAVPIAAGNASAITASIVAATQTNGGVMGFNNTPTRGAMAGATTYLQTLTTVNPKFILLATDGIPTCGTAGMMPDAIAAEATAAVTAANTAGFKTFVVGIATGGATADTTLSNLANAGGLAKAGTPSYYPVSSAADLAAAIRTLIGAANTCTFQIGPAPTSDGTTDLKQIVVMGDGTPIPRDTTHTNGYDYVDASMMSIQIYGSLCDQVMSGAIHEVGVNFICLIP